MFSKTLLSIVMLSLFIACNKPVVDSTNEGNKNLELIQMIMHMWHTGDTTGLTAICTPDVVYQDIPNGYDFKGIGGISQYIGHVHSWARDVRMEVVRYHAGDSSASAEWVMHAIQDRPIGGRITEATNKKITLPGLTLLETRDGKIHRLADYIDVATFVLQLGASIQLPGGFVWTLEEDTGHLNK